MTAPNPAVGAQPGWRGTDPDGGTWVRLTRRSGHPWLEITATGGLHFRTQEEAEAAGLVRLIPAVGYHYDERGEDVVPDVEGGAAPLDPGNPERFRQAAESAREMAKSPHLDTATWEHIAATFESQADRLDREHAEAEQDASDRAEADNYAKESSTTEEFWARHNAYLDGIRAERARQEAGQ
ncbi:hypothetical protein FK530_22940 [Tsukamurella conjunctivitidis]|uniref:Uncharacterized protein n=1 Tax=Tsukamurella conjunctivitidis TaxID=2592068 RepID=A0A5C5RSR1_9ACTN|nr:hypothetical protein [Tsukamurella conjunctivitidis]TWS25578.1 hypothetical protein FK530_22940 [Tsukamurella conjunctivitidis]